MPIKSLPLISVPVLPEVHYPFPYTRRVTATVQGDPVEAGQGNISGSVSAWVASVGDWIAPTG